MVYQIVLVQTSAYKETPVVVLPLVLQEGTGDAHRLVDVTVVAPHLVVHGILVVLHTTRQVGRQEEAAVEVVDILRTDYPRQVCSGTVTLCFSLGEK